VSSDAYARWSEARRTARRSARLARYRAGLRPFALAVWEITKEHNVGSLVRTAHAVAASEVILVGGREWNTYAACTADTLTRIVHLDDAEGLLEYLTLQRWSLVAVELDPRAVGLFGAAYPERPCFLLGAERSGVPQELLDAAEIVVQIPQWGLVPSLNLAVAGSIVAYDHLAKLHRAGALDRPEGGLPDTD
jgi:23S rRNA (guanosine2251-2'-O)-methyltransferase